MVLSYFVQGEEVSHSILFPSYDACSHSKGEMYDIFREYYYEDVHIFCKGTSYASNKIVRPKRRPL